MKMLIENADFAKIYKPDERLEIAKVVLPALIRNGNEGVDTNVAVRRALEIADEMLRQIRNKEEKK